MAEGRTRRRRWVVRWGTLHDHVHGWGEADPRATAGPAPVVPGSGVTGSWRVLARASAPASARVDVVPGDLLCTVATPRSAPWWALLRWLPVDALPALLPVLVRAAPDVEAREHVDAAAGETLWKVSQASPAGGGVLPGDRVWVRPNTSDRCPVWAMRWLTVAEVRAVRATLVCTRLHPRRLAPRWPKAVP